MIATEVADIIAKVHVQVPVLEVAELVANIQISNQPYTWFNM